MNKITAQEKEFIIDIVDSDGVEAIYKMMLAHADAAARDVLSFDLNNKSFANLALALAKYQGKQELVKKMGQELKTLRQKVGEQ